MQLVTPPPPFETVVGMAASAKDRSWRFLPVAPTTAFWPCWHVQKADLERVLRSPVIERSSIQELRLRADSAPKGIASRRTGVQAIAVISYRARNSLHHPKWKSPAFQNLTLFWFCCNGESNLCERSLSPPFEAADEEPA
jgi:hypothetical protein